jgi:hypothetical protein
MMSSYQAGLLEEGRLLGVAKGEESCDGSGFELRPYIYELMEVLSI